MTAVREQPVIRPSTSPAQRLRATMAAVRVAFCWFGVRKTLTPEQKAQAADTFGAEGQYLSAGKKLLDTRHPAFLAVTNVRHQLVATWQSMSLPYPEPAIRLIRQDKIDEFNRRMTELRQDLDEAVAQLRYSPPDAAELGDFPAPPEPMTDNPASLLTALRDASETAETASIRFALDHLELCGDSGTISATDSRQVLVQTGFSFPSQDKVLVPRSTLYGSKEVQPTAVAIGKTEEWLAIRIGPWLYQVKLGKELRFPNVTHHLQSPTGAVARLQIAPADAQFLDQSLPRLPGNDDTYRAVTLDMNGQIAIRARGEDQPQPTELLLSQSERSGDPLRISTDRRYLARALRLGFRELLFYAANAPVQCSDQTRHYLWAVLEPDSAIKPSAKAIRVAPAGSEPSTTDVTCTKNRKRQGRRQSGVTAPARTDNEHHRTDHESRSE